MRVLENLLKVEPAIAHLHAHLSQVLPTSSTVSAWSVCAQRMDREWTSIQRAQCFQYVTFQMLPKSDLWSENDTTQSM